MRRFNYLTCAILALSWIAPLHAQQPTSTVRGRITDNSTQQPISGATVAIAGKSALTHEDGRFSIGGVAVGAATVTVRMVGYAQGTQPVMITEGETVVDVALAPQAINLSEVV
ncbi:MAG TPA: carboxypeptidase-like regulatory domain-containing protein, partial [Gemmatimonadales bacterium]|nr:carboxypeptidase-like regulatory domain-containing protein [Gemmatimonadales bacterium]